MTTRLSSESFLSHKSNRQDSPTEPTLRDFANVNAALDTANAFKFMTGKQGEDRFGKMCAELKPLVIDLEAAA